MLHLAGLGHQRIGFINGGLIYNYAGLRRDSFVCGMAAAGLDLVPDLILENAVTPDEGAAMSGQLLGLAHPPTAIVCAVDRVALWLH